MKLNLGAGAHPLEGFVNLDKMYDGWTFESGLTDYGDGTIDAITESHGLMYAPLADWPFVFSEFARVLAPGAVVRITEDSTDDPHSSRYKGFHDAVTLTTRDLVRAHLEIAELVVEDVSPVFSHCADGSLIQRWHGDPPKVFFVEGVKP